MNTKRKSFGKKDKIKMLLWSDRHCCLCDKTCGIDIEIAHIKGKSDNSFDNGIPVCYDCHSKMGMYNELHPRGNKISAEEIKQRREQIYDKYTSQYIAPLKYVISNNLNVCDPQKGKRKFPDVTFYIVNLSNHLPIRLRILLKGKLKNRSISLNLDQGLYTGDRVWHLNPGRAINGHFEIKNKKIIKLNPDGLDIRVKITQIDKLEREHIFLEDGYVFNKKGDYWYFDP